MKKPSDIFVSTVIVFDEEAKRVEEKALLLSRTLKQRYANYEIIIIDNRMPKTELTKVKQLLDTTPCIRIIRLSRPQDTDTAIFAGVEASIGDIVCILYQNDPVALIPEFVSKIHDNQSDLVFGVARNLKRRSHIEKIGARLFYWYSKRYLHIDIPNGGTYFIAMNRSAANALTRSGRFMRHIRHMSKQVGFVSENYEYDLPDNETVYAHTKTSGMFARAIDLASNYSNHPLRVITYFGIFAGFLDIVYAAYVVVVNLSSNNVEKGWTSLSLEMAAMFLILFLILAILAEYIGKILNQTQQEPPYHIMQELSSKVSIADETRRNVTREL
jgi:glycosyltransferase involved in cell wall biosynthesis